MKYFIILFSFCCLVLSSASAQQTNKGATFYSRIKLKKIPTTIGMPFIVKQFCTAEIDSVIHAPRFFFENATIGKIKSCKLDYAMQNDTVQSITIYLTGQKNYNAAMKQAKKEFGPAVAVMEENEEMITWLTKNSTRDVQITLQRKNLEWGSEMIITLAKS